SVTSASVLTPDAGGHTFGRRDSLRSAARGASGIRKICWAGLFARANGPTGGKAKQSYYHASNQRCCAGADGIWIRIHPKEGRFAVNGKQFPEFCLLSRVDVDKN